MGLVEVGVGVIPGWGGCKEMLDALGDEPASAGRPDAAGRQGVRDDQHGAGLDLGRGGARGALPAPDGRHHDEPRPPARRRQGEGAGAGRRRLPAAGAGRDLAARPERQGGARHGGRRLPRQRRGDAARRGRRRAARPRAHRRRHRRHRDAHRGRPLALEREAFLALIQTPATLARIEHMLETGKPLRN